MTLYLGSCVAVRSPDVVYLHNQDVVDRFLRFQLSEGIPRAR